MSKQNEPAIHTAIKELRNAAYNSAIDDAVGAVKKLKTVGDAREFLKIKVKFEDWELVAKNDAISALNALRK